MDMADFWVAYILTLSIETPILYFLIRGKYTTISIIQNSIIANSITLPFVWFAFPLLGLGWTVQIAIAELFAFACEIVIYKKLFGNISWEQATFASFVCNAISFGIGLLIV